MAFGAQTKIKTCVTGSTRRLGVTSNFEVGLKAAECEIVVFADRDEGIKKSSR